MKHILPLLVGLLCLNGIVKAQDPTITMTTAKAVGENISFSLSAQSNNTTIQVDFGNGTKVNYTINTASNDISGSLVGSQTVKIYGTGITYLSCFSNQLTALDVTKCTALEDLRCFSNQLTALDVTKCTTLTYLNCSSNKLTSLNVTQCTALTSLSCSWNLVTALDVTKCTVLTSLWCERNQLTALDITKCTALKTLCCRWNQLTALDVTKCTKLDQILCNSNNLTAIDITQCIALTNLYCDVNKLTSLDVTKCTALKELICSVNQLTTLDVTKCTAMTSLSCYSNKLTALDVTKCTALTTLFCDRNQLTALDVTKSTALTSLSCYKNKLMAIDITKCTTLEELWCYSNQLSLASLPIKQATWTLYSYAPQAPLTIPTTIAPCTTVDLSAQATANGNVTTFTWKTVGGTTLVEGTDYTIANGVTTFLNTQSELVYCEMTNATFPNFTGTKVLKTTEASIKISTSVNTPTASAIDMYAIDGTLHVTLEVASQITVTDMQGHQVASAWADGGHTTLALTSSGLYVVRVMSPNKVTTRKVMVK